MQKSKGSERSCRNGDPPQSAGLSPIEKVISPLLPSVLCGVRSIARDIVLIKVPRISRTPRRLSPMPGKRSTSSRGNTYRTAFQVRWTLGKLELTTRSVRAYAG